MPPLTDQVYQAFLLRCWLIPSQTVGEPAVWRFEIQAVGADVHRHRFSDLAQLQAVVAAQLTAVANGTPDDEESQKDSS